MNAKWTNNFKLIALGFFSLSLMSNAFINEQNSEGYLRTPASVEYEEKRKNIVVVKEEEVLVETLLGTYRKRTRYLYMMNEESKKLTIDLKKVKEQRVQIAILLQNTNLDKEKIAELKGKLSRLSSERDELSQRVVHLKRQHTEEKTKLQGDISKLSEEKQTLMTRQKELQTEVANLGGENQEISASLSEKIKELDELRLDAARVSLELKEAKEELQAQFAEAETLQGALDIAEGNIDEQRGTIQNLQSKVSELEIDLANANQVIVERDQTIVERDQTIVQNEETISTRNTELEQRRIELDEQLLELERIKCESKNELTALKEEMETLTDDKIKIVDTLKEVRESLKTSQTSNTEKDALLVAAREQIYALVEQQRVMQIQMSYAQAFPAYQMLDNPFTNFSSGNMNDYMFQVFMNNQARMMDTADRWGPSLNSNGDFQNYYWESIGNGDANSYIENMYDSRGYEAEWMSQYSPRSARGRTPSYFNFNQ